MADLKALAVKNHEYVVKMRRHFHKYPEISTQEKETSKRICEELEAMGVNDSVIHVDFMIGTDDMEITGITAEGEEIAIFRNGTWAF